MNETIDHLDITEATLLIDPRRVRANINAMAAKARRSGVHFRPHFKTHQSAAIAGWFREAGVDAATVSSLAMAEYFADHGWQDLTVALLVNPREMGRITRLATRVKLHLVVDSVVVVDALAAGLDGLPSRGASVWIKIDTGYGRTGVRWDDAGLIADVARRIDSCDRLAYAGLLTHSGHAYEAAGPDALRRVYAQTVERLQRARGAPTGSRLSLGDTPTCSVVDDFSAVDEIRPGNFVFNDLMQLALGGCTADGLALAVACPVVGKYPERRQLVIHGGAVHLGKESLPSPDGAPIFGCLTDLRDGSFEPPRLANPVVSLSQEHGIVTADSELLSRVEIGDPVLVFPVHACLTAAMFSSYTTFDGEILSRRDRI